MSLRCADKFFATVINDNLSANAARRFIKICLCMYYVCPVTDMPCNLINHRFVLEHQAKNK